jgi:hypothetical protein
LIGYRRKRDVNKYERREHRKDMRKAHNDAERRERDKHKRDKVKPKWRKLNDGGYAFGDKFKIGRGGLIAFSCIGCILLFFAVGLTLYPLEAQEGGTCANPWCEWMDVLTGADEYGAKQTPKEQVPEEDRDFMPPDKIDEMISMLPTPSLSILPYFLELPELIGGGVAPIFLPHAEARGETEPVCYTKGCFKNIGKTPDGQGKETKSANPNKEVQDAKDELQEVEDDIRRLEKLIGEIDIELAEIRLEINILENEVEDQEDVVKEMKRQVRHAYDQTVTREDTERADELSDVYKEELKELGKLDDDLTKKITEKIDKNILLADSRDELTVAEMYLPVVLDRVSGAKVDANLQHQEHQFISIQLSETCNTLIRDGYNEVKVAMVDETGWVYDEEISQRCPTNQILKDTFDNTIPGVSGEWVERDNDIHREPSKKKDYWKYYKQMPNWKIITVEPDFQMYTRSAVIEVQARGFIYASHVGSSDKSPSYTPGSIAVNGTITPPTTTIHSDIIIGKKCKHVTVAPDLELITKAVNHLMENCKDKDSNLSNPITTQLPFLPPQVQDSEAWKYLKWLKEIAKSFRVE